MKTGRSAGICPQIKNPDLVSGSCPQMQIKYPDLVSGSCPGDRGAERVGVTRLKFLKKNYKL